MADPRPMRLRNATVDARDPRALAEFYRSLTGWEYTPGHESTDPSGDDWLSLQIPGGARVHVDLDVPDLAAAHEHAVACGARPLTGTPEDEGHPDDLFRVYADPEGHPFCLSSPPLDHA